MTAERLDRIITTPNRAAVPKVCRLVPLATCLLVLLASCKSHEAPAAGEAAMPPLEVTAVKIVPADLPVVLDYLGQTEGSRVIEVRTRVEGVLQKMNFTEGKMVKAGEVLYRLDPKQFEITLENVRAELAQEEARLENARRSVRRLKPLVEQNAVSQKDLDDAVSAETTATAVVRGAKAKVNEAEMKLGYTVIKAPISGVAGRSLKQEGSLLSPGTDGQLTTVSQLDPLYVNFNVSENEMIRYNDEEKNKSIRFPKGGNFDVALKLCDGTIAPVTGKLNFTNPLYNKETGTLSVRAVVKNPGFHLLPGQYVRVLLKGGIRPNAIVVPQRAVMQGQKGKFVVVVDAASKAEMRNVEVGEWSGENWIITSGLKAGETVVVDGAMKLQAGMPVKVAASPDAKGQAKGGGDKETQGAGKKAAEPAGR